MSGWLACRSFEPLPQPPGRRISSTWGWGAAAPTEETENLLALRSSPVRYTFHWRQRVVRVVWCGAVLGCRFVGHQCGHTSFHTQRQPQEPDPTLAVKIYITVRREEITAQYLAVLKKKMCGCGKKACKRGGTDPSVDTS